MMPYGQAVLVVRTTCKSDSSDRADGDCEEIVQTLAIHGTSCSTLRIKPNALGIILDRSVRMSD